MNPLTLKGDPAALESLASRFGTAATNVAEVQQRVAANTLAGEWSGEASERFRGALSPLPGHLQNIATAFDEAGRTVGSFANSLAGLQREANLYNEELASYEHEAAVAQERADAEQTRLDEARLRHSLANDPVSITTTRTAVDLGESLVRQALSHVEEVADQAPRLAQWEARIAAEYQLAVASCCEVLDASRSEGTTPFAGWLARHLDALGAAAAGMLGALVAALMESPWRQEREDQLSKQELARLTTTIGVFGISSWREAFTGLQSSASAHGGLSKDGMDFGADAAFFLGARTGFGTTVRDGSFAAELDGSEWAGVKGNATSEFLLGRDGLDASTSAEVEAGVSGTLHDRVGYGDFYSEDTVEAFAGASANADADLTISPDGEATAKADVGAFAGADIQASRTVDVGGVGAHAGAGVTVGVGATAGADASFGTDDIGFHTHAKISLGIGLSAEVGMEIHPKEIMKTTDNAYHDVDHSWQSADSALHNLL
jgi:WXG100 family type VII secretion target